MPRGGAERGSDPGGGSLAEGGQGEHCAMDNIKTNLPMHTFKQHQYPRLRGWSVGKDGESTTQLTLSLPCCGLDLLNEHPPTMTAVELYQIAGEFHGLYTRVKELCTTSETEQRQLPNPETQTVLV